MASLIEAIDIKRKMFFEYEGAPYHVLDVEVSRPTARGGQTLVRIKMRNLVTRAGDVPKAAGGGGVRILDDQRQPGGALRKSTPVERRRQRETGRPQPPGRQAGARRFARPHDARRRRVGRHRARCNELRRRRAPVGIVRKP